MYSFAYVSLHEQTTRGRLAPQSSWALALCLKKHITNRLSLVAHLCSYPIHMLQNAAVIQAADTEEALVLHSLAVAQADKRMDVQLLNTEEEQLARTPAAT